MNYKRPGLDVEDIKAALRKKYGPLVRISQQLGLNPNAVSATIRSISYSIQTEVRIAKLLGKTPFEIWGPERFNPDNTPVKRSVRQPPVKPVPAELRKTEAA